MWRSVAVILLLLAFVAQNFHKALIVADYYANTASFAKNCENKAFPKMHCNGKCQMMKKLKEQAGREHQNPERKTENKTDVFSISSSFAVTADAGFKIVSFFHNIYIYKSTSDRPSDIFHPPSLS